MTDDELLAKYAFHSNLEPDRWYIGTSSVSRSREQVVRLIRAQLALGVEVTDTLTLEAFAELAERLIALERKLDRHG